MGYSKKFYMNITFFLSFSVVMDWKIQELVLQKYFINNKKYSLRILTCNDLLKQSCPAITAYSQKKITKSKKLQKFVIDVNLIRNILIIS